MPTSEWLPPTSAQMNASDQFVQIIKHALATEKGCEAETAIASAGRMAGTFLLRSFQLPIEDLEEGTAIDYAAAGEYGPMLFTSIQAVLHSFKVELDNSKIDGLVPLEHRPKLSLAATQRLLETPFRKVAQVFDLSLEQTAHTCALSAGHLICLTSGILDPHLGFSLAGTGFIEGSKTVPIPLEEIPDRIDAWHFIDRELQSKPQSRSWYRFWEWFN